MNNKLLQPFLQAGLIDIGDSDERLKNIEQSIADLQKKFEESYSLLPTYTLVGLDPEVPADEPTVVDTESLISEHWKALRAKFSERPISIIRAVILNALYNVGINDAYAARIIYLTASNFYPYAKLGRENDIIKRIILELGDIAEQAATEEWSLVDENPDLKLGTLKISGLKLETVNLDTTNLKAKLLEASNRSSGYNPYNHPNEWAESFSTHATEGISNAIKGGITSLTKTFDTTTIEGSINKFFADFKKSLDHSLKNSFNSIRAVERRSKLLWWKETLYSPSIKNSYRTLDVIVQPIIMAHDLYDQLPEITPVSVDFLLRDTLLLLNKSANEKTTFGDYLSAISKKENKTILKDYLKVGKEQGKMALTDFFSLVVNDGTNASMLKQCTGVDENEPVSLLDISAIVLHDLLTSYLVSE